MKLLTTLAILLISTTAEAWVCGSSSGPGPAPADCAYESNRWPAMPFPNLKVVTVTDLDQDGGYDNDDIDLALTECAPACNLELLPVTYTNVMMKLDGSPALTTLGIVGAGLKLTKLEAHIRTGDLDTALGTGYVPIIWVNNGAPTDLVIQDLSFDGMMLYHNAGSACNNSSYSGAAVVWDGWVGGTLVTPQPDVNHIVRRVHSTHNGAHAFGVSDFGGVVIEDNTLEYSGCYPGVIPCSPSWEACPAADGGGSSPRRLGSLAIVTGRNTRDVTIQRNKVRWSAKMGIQTFAGNPDPCGASAPSARNTLIQDNEVGPVVGVGIGLNGACDAIVQRNYVHDVVFPGFSGGDSDGHGIQAPTAGRSIIRDNIVENTWGLGVQVNVTTVAPLDTDFLKLINNKITDPCQGMAAGGCAGIGASGYPGAPFPVGVIAGNTVTYKDLSVNHPVTGLSLNSIKNTDIYDNHFEGSGWGVRWYDLVNVKFWGNSITRVGTGGNNACMEGQNETSGAYTTVPANVTFHADNTCTGWGTRSRNSLNTNVMDDCGGAVANTCYTSGGACPGDNDALCSIIDCHATRTPTAAVCTTPVTSTTTTTLPLTSDVYLPPEPTFPIGDEHLLVNTGRLEHTTKTECLFLEARDGECLTAPGVGCTPSTVSTALTAYKTMDFAPGADNFASWSFETPKNMVGQDATVQYVWMGTDAGCNGTAASSDVCWTIDGGSAGDQDAWTVPVLGGVAKSVTDRCAVIGDILQSPPITFTHGMLPAQRATILVNRDSDGSTCTGAGDDDYATNARLLAARVCFEVNNFFSGE